MAWQEILALTKPALASLERRDWPGGEMVLLQRTTRTLLGREKRNERACWPVAEYGYDWEEGVYVDSTVFLLSDGRLAIRSSRGVSILKGDLVQYVIEASGVWMHVPLSAIKRGLQELIGS